MNTLKEMDTIPALKPITAAWITGLLNKPDDLSGLLEKWGSPVNIHHTASFEQNYEEYRQVFEELDLDHLVFFARKANKCKGFVTKAKKMGIGVDTASLEELAQCLEAGIAPEKLVVTAAVKNRELIKLALHNRVLVIVDNEDEAHQIQAMAEELGSYAKIGIRISGFFYEGEKLYSRFGFDIEEVEGFLRNRVGEGKSLSRLQYSGLHFHLNGYSTDQRSVALIQSMELAKRLQAHHFSTQFIDIGGGFLMNYLESREQWLKFQEELRAAVSLKRPPITFGNDGLGFSLIDGKIQGGLNTYSFWNDTCKSGFLKKILSYSLPDGTDIASMAKQLNIQIRMEPGRSLLDQAGITVSRVAFRKKDSRGDWLIGLEMNMTQLYSSSADFLLDPYVINKETLSDAEAVGVYFTGAYCLERDIVLKRKISLPQLPAIGDLVVFINTAGYMMHFFESNAHLFPLAVNLFVKEETFGSPLTDFEED